MKHIKKILRAIAESIEKGGFPKEPFIIQSNPEEEFSFFIALWRNIGERTVTVVGIKRES